MMRHRRYERGRSLVMLLGMVARLQNEHEPASRFFAESLHLLREAGDRWASTFSLLNLAGSAVTQGAYEEATPYIREAMARSREMADQRGIV